MTCRFVLACMLYLLKRCSCWQKRGGVVVTGGQCTTWYARAVKHHSADAELVYRVFQYAACFAESKAQNYCRQFKVWPSVWFRPHNKKVKLVVNLGEVSPLWHVALPCAWLLDLKAQELYAIAYQDECMRLHTKTAVFLHTVNQTISAGNP